MPFLFDVARVALQQVEHVVAFMLVRTDDPGVDRHMVGDQRVGADAFFVIRSASANNP